MSRLKYKLSQIIVIVGMAAPLLLGAMSALSSPVYAAAQGSGGTTACPGASSGTPSTDTTQDSTEAQTGSGISLSCDSNTAKYQCGSGLEAVTVSVDLGCSGDLCTTYPNPDGTIHHGSTSGYCTAGQDNNAIVDMVFAIIRFLSYGVGVVVVASVVVAGIQFSMSRGDPNAVAGATKRLQSTVVALLIYIFAFALLNYLIPAGFFNGA